MRSFILAVTCLLAIAGCDRSGGLIARQTLFGAPERFQFRLSPDGTQMSYLAPVDGVLNVWVAPRGHFEQGHPITNDRHQGIYLHIWAPNGHTILYRQDRSGTENWRVYALDVASGRELDLTPFDGVQAELLELSNKLPDEALITMNRRDPRYADVYRANLQTGAVELIEKNLGFSDFVADNDLNIRFALAPTPDGGYRIFERTAAGWKPSGDVAPADALTFAMLDFDSTNKRLYMVDSRGRDTAALTRYTPTTGETEILGQDERADIAKLLIEPQTRAIQAFTVNYSRREWKVIDPSIEEDLKTLSIAAGKDGEFEIVDRIRDDSTWVVFIDKVVEPGAYYLYDRSTRALTLLFSSKPALVGTKLVPMHSAVIKSRDNLDLVLYYSLPASVSLRADGTASRKSPLVVVAHGGPWSRDKYGLDEWHQWLANRGYAVLSVNFRGSTGYGKAFTNAGDGQWGGAMIHDIEDAVDWAVKENIAKPDKVAIAGGHYGGYAALAGLAFTPSRYACAISVGGPSNLVTMLKSTPPYWTSIKDLLLRRIGDPSTPTGRELLDLQSPALHAQGIVKPLLLVQGANDPETNEGDTLSLVHDLKERSVPVTYLLYPDEGTLIQRPVNQISFYAVAESFLGHCLGGAVEPFGGSLKGSSIQVMDGAENIPGLAKALGDTARQPH